MNHLAHALLAGPDDDVIFGSVLADFVRGAIDPALPLGVRNGVALHRAVDSFTDSHPAVVAARRSFEPPYRRYAGILLDIWFDHLLARNWSRFSAIPLDRFSRHLRALLDTRRAQLPDALRRFADYMTQHDLPAAYADLDEIALAFRGVSNRLSRANPIAGAEVELVRRETALAATFEEFFPRLIAYAADMRARLSATRTL